MRIDPVPDSGETKPVQSQFPKKALPVDRDMEDRWAVAKKYENAVFCILQSVWYSF
jgi:hypothetical protein